ncbi:TonB-dependent receptor [Proteiniphilum sp.]|uniref:TonB-dependent receptor n=1 Tax=Proteiniphilum sp. TaxID=1926877 RepID=UPI002B218EBE|nr:TonB-dependent receptor [Proteiniphilum sp.]MEA4918450.1 TonB-dependent receptor [Proteiniphilum sp.]
MQILRFIRLAFLWLSIVFSATVAGQNGTPFQTVRGKINDKQTFEAVELASVLLFNENRQYVTVSAADGEFSIAGVAVGRYAVRITLLGYFEYNAGNILVYSRKETVLDISLEQRVTLLDELQVTPKVEKDQPLNRMATVSARMLSMEEANRYAASWGDVGRMAANLAGVAAANDSRNDIIIRGNSPMGVLWRLDGFEIPNPNHFGTMGGTGGPIGMLNNNQLTNSDFYTGAFPAQFGNATSGVFDLKMRNGNNRKREYLMSIGFNGLELGAEGYFTKNANASYLINGRYSFLEIMQAVGEITSSLQGTIPKYKDLSAKINVPLNKANLSFIALLGASGINLLTDMSDSTQWKPGDWSANSMMSNTQIFFGLNYTQRFGTSTRLENRFSYQKFTGLLGSDKVSFNNEETERYYRGDNREARPAWQSVLYHRFDVKNFLQTGVGADYLMTQLRDTVYKEMSAIPFHDADKNLTLLKAFAQWQHRFNDNLSLIPGVYTQYYTLAKDFSIEPRLGFKWNITQSLVLNAGSGLYSQIQPRQIYFYIDENGKLPNETVKMSRSWQNAAGIDWKVTKSVRIKTEVYYQHLYNIPVTPDVRKETILNIGDDFYNNWDYTFENKGKGRNYGVDITIEKFFEQDYYILATASLYESKYTDYDGVERDSRFNGNFSLNLLGGYEFKLGNHSLLTLNSKISWLGGKRYLDIYMDENGDTQIQPGDEAFYSKQFPNYFKLDFNVGMKTNYKRLAVEWFMELGNLTNHKNIITQYYNQNQHKMIYSYQSGFMPMGGCKVFF